MINKRITIKKIAQLSDVSAMTVSRVINNDPRVKEETRQKILKLIEKYKYRPNPRARAFARNRTKLIGIIIPSINSTFFCELTRGVEDNTYERGYSIAMCSTDDKLEKTETYVNQMIDAGVDGIIYCSSRLRETIVEKLVAERFPVVLAVRKMESENYNYVVLDNFKGAKDITEYLLGLGHRKVAIITGPSYISTGLDRLNGYKAALKEKGIKPVQSYIFQGAFARSTGFEGARNLLALPDPPEAILAATDDITLGAIDAIVEKGLRIPQDIALVGFDDTALVSSKMIQLTTVDHRQYQMGNMASQILIDYIEREETDYIHKVVLEPRIIRRKTCGGELFKQSNY